MLPDLHSGTDVEGKRSGLDVIYAHAPLPVGWNDLLDDGLAFVHVCPPGGD